MQTNFPHGYTPYGPAQRPKSKRWLVILLTVAFAAALAWEFMSSTERDKLVSRVTQQYESIVGELALEEPLRKEPATTQARGKSSQTPKRSAAIQPKEKRVARLLSDSRHKLMPGDKKPFKIRGVYSGAMTFAEDSRGLWLATKYDLNRFAGEELREFKQVLSASIFRKAAASSMAALASFVLLPGGEIWTGSWHGDLMRFDGKRWSGVAKRNQPVSGKVSMLVAHQNQLLIGARNGLWSWDIGTGQAIAVPSIRQAVTGHTITANGDIFVSTRKAVWRKARSDWVPVWHTTERNDYVNAVYALDSSLILVATHDGYYQLRPGAEHAGKRLGGRWVTSFAAAPGGRLWVGTWKSGLMLWDGAQWFNMGEDQGLADNSVYALYIDRQDRLWISLYGKGNLVMREEDAVRWIKTKGWRYLSQ
mgnify:CR=1 FL=1